MVVTILAWLAVDVLFLFSALAVARRRERSLLRSVATLVERAERHANRAPLAE